MQMISRHGLAVVPSAIALWMVGCSGAPASETNKLPPVGLASIQASLLQAGSGNLSCSPLIAGQTDVVGDVCLSVDGDSLLVVYQTFDDWSLDETQMWLGTSLATMPQTTNGAPKIGLFPFKSGDIFGATTWTFEVSLEEYFGLNGEETGCEPIEILLAAHATVRSAISDGGAPTETAWAEGPRIVDSGTWATYWTAELQCIDEPGPEGEPHCETAFAYTSEAQAFCSNDINGDGRNERRWGWFGEIGPGSYSFDLYAGAGRCELSRGTLVGSFDLEYSGSTATGTFWPESGLTLNATHVYLDHVAQTTLAPGQFTSVLEGSGETSAEHVVFDLEEDTNVFFSAHAEVCAL